MKNKRIIALLMLLLIVPALAQVNPGTTPLSGSKGGTNNAWMQFSGPTSSTIKTFFLPNVSDTIATLGTPRTWTAAQSFTDADLILLGATSGSSVLHAPATSGGNVTFFTGNDTVVGRASTDTLTNKTFNFANNTMAGQLAIANGGTGQATQQLALNALGPTPIRTGDLLVYNATSGGWVNFGGNNSGTQALVENSVGQLLWQALAGGGTVTNVNCFGVAITSTGTCATAATKSDQQTASSPTAVVTPLHQQDHDSALKSHGCATISGTTLTNCTNNYNGSWARSTTGVYVWTTSTHFADTNYDCTMTAANLPVMFELTSTPRTASAIAVTTFNTSMVAADAAIINIQCAGRQ